jgi:hypothetical protein
MVSSEANKSRLKWGKEKVFTYRLDFLSRLVDVRLRLMLHVEYGALRSFANTYSTRPYYTEKATRSSLKHVNLIPWNSAPVVSGRGKNTTFGAILASLITARDTYRIVGGQVRGSRRPRESDELAERRPTYLQYQVTILHVCFNWE